MENKAHALIAGLFTLALLIGAIAIGIWLNRDRVEWVPYEIATTMSIPGLNPQAAVRYRGLDVGKVDEITFNPQVVGQILIRISVQPDTPITRSTFATLGYQGVTGIAYVQLDDDGTSPVKMPSSENQVARIEMRPSLLDQLQNQGLAILEQTQEIARRLTTMLDPANQQKILGAFDNVSNAAVQVEAIPRKLQPTLAQLPALTSQTRQTLNALTALSKDVSTLSNNLNSMTVKLQAPQGPLDKIADSAEQLGAVAGRLEHETLPLTNDARTSIRSLNRMLDNLNDRPQSLLFGVPPMTPGPGEPGFTAPTR